MINYLISWGSSNRVNNKYCELELMVTEQNLITSEDRVETPTLGLWQQIKEDWIAHGRD